MKKRNIKLVIEYDGTSYCGWQSQSDNHPTVQETVRKAIKVITSKRVILYGASRTDSGVHSLGQVASFTSHTKLVPERLRAALNKNLPCDIVVRKVEDVPPRFNAQFPPKAKTYCYTIINDGVPSALQRHFTYFVNGKRLNLKAMKKGARYLRGRHDFRAFASSNRGRTRSRGRENCVREIYSLTIDRAGRVIQITIRGSGFLFNMVRTIVGTLLLVGKNKIQPEEVKKILESADRTRAGQTAPPHGLCLIKVEY